MSNGRGGRSTRQWMLWAFKLHGCVDCGAKYPEIALEDLQCDHRDPTTKNTAGRRRNLNGNADGLLGHQGNRQLLHELLKCDVVCFECHRARTRRRAIGNHYEQQVMFNGTGEAWRVVQGGG